MDHHEAKEPIRIYLDEATEPFKEEQPPLRFQFNTIHLPDGPHVLRVEASNGLAPPTTKKIPFTVRNGVAVSVSGLESGQTISGQVEMIVNAFAGNTEVDFEPRKAETPTPVPTWAWVLLLGVFAWTLFYVLNPADERAFASVTEVREPSHVGARIYTDTCARCHGEQGEGRKGGDGSFYPVPPLLDSRNYALASSPLNLLLKVVQGADGTAMPAWGPFLNNDEIVAVVNHVRTSWRHDASTINLEYYSAPAAIDELEGQLETALIEKNADALAQCCWPRGGRRPQLYRTDGVRARGQENVKRAWQDYFEALGDGRITGFELLEKSYDYEPSTVSQNGSIVIGMGRIFLQVERGDASVQEQGRFIRVYQLWEGSWALVFDFADIPMNVGCDVGEVYCPPEEEGTGPGIERPTPAAGSKLGFADVRKILAGLGRGPRDAPHEDFWNWDYDKFCTGTFEESWSDPTKIENKVRIVVPGRPAQSNLIRVLEGRPMLVTLPDGSVVEHAVDRMPKNGPYASEAVIAELRAWIVAGCPEVAGGEPHPSAGSPPTDSDTETPPGPPAPSGGLTIGFADVVKMIEDTGKGAGDSPHEAFWKLPWDEFCRFEFEESWNDADLIENKVRLVVPGNPEKSNFLRALEGSPLLIRLPDGSEVEREKPQMPKNGPYLTPEQLAKIRAWIAAGCPETPGGPPHPTAETPAGGSEPPATPSAEPPISKIGFDEVRQYLKDLGKSATNIPHGSFWNELEYEAFVAFSFPREWGDEYEYRLLIPYDAKNSNLIKVLRDGRGVVREDTEGHHLVEDLPRMPRNAPPMPEERIREIEIWIDAGCPKVGGEPSELPRPEARAAAGDPGEDLNPKGDAPPQPGGGFPAPGK